MLKITDYKAQSRLGGFELGSINTHMAPGQCWAILGANGAGKSSLMSLIAGMKSRLRRTNGEITLIGNCGFIPQQVKLPPRLTPRDIARYAILVQDLQIDISNIEAIFKQFDLSEYLDTKIEKLSGGNQQKVALAVSVLLERNILILDEPTVGLDLNARVDFQDAIKTINPTRVVIVSSHLSEDIESLATHILHLKQGKQIFSGTKEDYQAGFEDISSAYLSWDSNKLQVQ